MAEWNIKSKVFPKKELKLKKMEMKLLNFYLK